MRGPSAGAGELSRRSDFSMFGRRRLQRSMQLRCGASSGPFLADALAVVKTRRQRPTTYLQPSSWKKGKSIRASAATEASCKRMEALERVIPRGISEGTEGNIWQMRGPMWCHSATGGQLFSRSKMSRRVIVILLCGVFCKHGGTARDGK